MIIRRKVPARSARRRDPARAGGRAGGRGLAVAALLLVAFNLRPAVTSLGPVLAEARSALGMSGAAAGLLTSVPALCFALVGVAAPRLSRRYGPSAVVAAGTAVVAVGLVLRPLAGGTLLFLALSALALAGIAVANVLLPVVVKQRFPGQVGRMTGLYSMALNLGAAVAAAATVPLSGAFGGQWRWGLGAWGVVAALAVPPWIVLARLRTADRPPRTAAGPGPAPAGPPPGPASGPGPGAGMTRSPTAWALAAYFGLQAGAAYVVIGWLPQMYRDAGLPAGRAGLLFAVTSLLGVPLSFALSALAGRLRRQSGIAVALGVSGLAGYAGLWAAPAAAPWVWAVLLGVANCSFPLALTMIGLRGRNSATVVRLSAFAQSTGYLLSIPVPFLVGALYEHTDGWRIPLVFLAVLMVAQLAAGVLAGRDRSVG
ncbi:MFS transporter [Actinacidiphila glaucinigra]|uniref:MFS transporter n=1 Tax=Actinacidiphila glaucinigra TaxID=235986 RepID=UPI0036E88AF6